MTGATHVQRLERRYRRLLACYPAQHRALYDEEMIGVLMAASTPNQRRPGTVEAVNLVVSGLRTRLRTTLRATRPAAWQDAASVFGYVTSALIAAVSVYQVAPTLVWRSPLFPVSWTGVALAIGWAIAAIAAGLGQRHIAAAAAAAGVLGQAIVMARAYAEDPSSVVTSWWRLVLAITAAVSIVALARPSVPTASTGERPRPLGVRSTVMIGAAAILVCVAPLTETHIAVIPPLGTSGPAKSYRIPDPPLHWPGVWERPLSAVAVLALVVTVAIVALRLTPTIRRRVLLLAAPAIATAILVVQTFGGFLASSPRFSPPVHLVAAQWIALVAAPALVFSIGAWALARYERRLASGALLA